MEDDLSYETKLIVYNFLGLIPDDGTFYNFEETEFVPSKPGWKKSYDRAETEAPEEVSYKNTNESEREDDRKGNSFLDQIRGHRLRVVNNTGKQSKRKVQEDTTKDWITDGSEKTQSLLDEIRGLPLVTMKKENDGKPGNTSKSDADEISKIMQKALDKVSEVRRMNVAADDDETSSDDDDDDDLPWSDDDNDLVTNIGTKLSEIGDVIPPAVPTAKTSPPAKIDSSHTTDSNKSAESTVAEKVSASSSDQISDADSLPQRCADKTRYSAGDKISVTDIHKQIGPAPDPPPPPPLFLDKTKYSIETDGVPIVPKRENKSSGRKAKDEKQTKSSRSHFVDIQEVDVDAVSKSPEEKKNISKLKEDIKKGIEKTIEAHADGGHDSEFVSPFDRMVPGSGFPQGESFQSILFKIMGAQAIRLPPEEKAAQASRLSSEDEAAQATRQRTEAKKVAHVFRDIGDAYNKDKERQRAVETGVNQLSRQARETGLTYDSIRDVARGILSTATSGLMKVAGSLVFSQKLLFATMALRQGQVELITEYTTKLIMEECADFIKSNGGWAALSAMSPDVTESSAVKTGGDDQVP